MPARQGIDQSISAGGVSSVSAKEPWLPCHRVGRALQSETAYSRIRGVLNGHVGTNPPARGPVRVSGLRGRSRRCVLDASSTSSVSGHPLDAVLRLSGGDPGAWLYIEINGAYAGPGSYDLPPWPGPLGSSDGEPKVAIQQDGTGAVWQYVNGGPILRYGTDELWQSVAGVLTITGSDGRSGTLAAILQLSVGHNTTVSSSTISAVGPWRCS